MKCLFVTSEAQPFAASGGLADVSGSLPHALRQRLIGCRIVMPLYEDIPDELKESMRFLTSFSVPVAWRRQYCGVFEARFAGVIYYFIDNQYYFKRYGNAKEETAQKYQEVRQGFSKAKSKERRWRYIFYGLCAAWVLLLLICGITESGRQYIFQHSMMTIGLPVGGMTAIIVGLRAYFRGYGFVMSCLWGLLGMISSYIPILILRTVDASAPSLFIPAIIIITLLYMAVCHLTDYRSDSKGDNQLINEVMEDDIKSTLIEPLFYTFKQKTFKFKGSKFGLLDDVTNQVRSLSGESVLHYILWSIMVAILLMEMIPAEVVEKIQEDVEQKDAEPEEAEKDAAGEEDVKKGVE